MTHEEHKARHIILHRYLDELAADWLLDTGELPSKKTIFDFMTWSHSQTINPSEITEFHY